MQIKKEDILAYLVFLNYYRNNCAYSRQRRLCSIKSFYRWLSDNYPNIIDNPVKSIKNIEPCYRLPKHLSLNQAKKIQTIFTLKNSKTPIRNNAIISLLLSTGMRASELININIKDINFNDKSIKVHGKGNKERVVYFNEHCKILLKKYLDIRGRDKNNIDKKALFINIQHKRIGIDGIEDICQKAYNLIGLNDKGYTTHTLRHTAATITYRYVKQDILLIKEMLGHSSINSTQIYTHIYNKEVKEGFEKNPLSNEIGGIK